MPPRLREGDVVVGEHNVVCERIVVDERGVASPQSAPRRAGEAPPPSKFVDIPTCTTVHSVYTVYMNIHSTFTISQTDGRPMYLQIIEQVRHKVAVGDWAPGTEIPSIRQLAAELSVSVITIKRAYQELEREGVILTQQGRGSIVSHSPTLSSALWEQQLSQSLDQAARLAQLLGITSPDLTQRLHQAINNLKEE
jgi:GntR family transcriptional regulator